MKIRLARPSRVGILLLIILLLALGLRLHGIGFGLPALYDPDEPLFIVSALKLLRDQTLNPGWFGHPGTTTIYALALIDMIVFSVGFCDGPAARYARVRHGNLYRSVDRSAAWTHIHRAVRHRLRVPDLPDRQAAVR